LSDNSRQSSQIHLSYTVTCNDIEEVPVTNEHSFLHRINALRQDLAQLADAADRLCDPRIVAASQRLDEYIIAIQRVRLNDYPARAGGFPASAGNTL
jgi:hypothetical protein